MAKVKLDYKAAGLRSARLLRVRIAIGLTATISKLYCNNYVGRTGVVLH